MKLTNKDVKLLDYNIIRNDRIDRVGGGVALYVHKSLKFKVLNHSNNCGLPEYLLCEITLHSKLFIVVV